MGATVERVRPSVSITHKDHFENVARHRALEARATDSAPELQLYDLAKQDPQLEKKLDQHVRNRVSAVLDLEAVRLLSFQEPRTRSESGSTNASGPAAEEFVMSSEKKIVACVMAGAANGSDVKNSEAEHPSGNVFRVDASCDSPGQGRGGYLADQFKNLANLQGFGGSTEYRTEYHRRCFFLELAATGRNTAHKPSPATTVATFYRDPPMTSSIEVLD